MRGAGQRQAAERLHQRTGERGAVQPQLAGPHRMAAGAVRKQIQLLLLDAVLALAAGAVLLLADRLDRRGCYMSH